jgi:hypothetical protein
MNEWMNGQKGFTLFDELMARVVSLQALKAIAEVTVATVARSR